MAIKEKDEEKTKVYEYVEMEVILVDIKSKNNRTVYFKHNENDIYKVQEVLVQHQAIPIRNIGDKQVVTYDVQENRYFIAYEHYRNPKNDLIYLKDGIPKEVLKNKK